MAKTVMYLVKVHFCSIDNDKQGKFGDRANEVQNILVKDNMHLNMIFFLL